MKWHFLHDTFCKSTSHCSWRSLICAHHHCQCLICYIVLIIFKLLFTSIKMVGRLVKCVLLFITLFIWCWHCFVLSSKFNDVLITPSLTWWIWSNSKFWGRNRCCLGDAHLTLCVLYSTYLVLYKNLFIDFSYIWLPSWTGGKSFSKNIAEKNTREMVI